MKASISIESLIIVAIILIVALIVVKLVTNITTSTKAKIESANKDLNNKLKDLCKAGDVNCEENINIKLIQYSHRGYLDHIYMSL